MLYHETEHGKLYLGDCLDILPTLADKSIDLILTDPPYGIKRSGGFRGFGGFRGNTETVQIKRRYYPDTWDNQRPCAEVFNLMLSLSKLSLIFGGNYFADMLPMSTHWLVWDKKNTMPTFSDCELIWTNSRRKSVVKYEFEYNGLIGKEKKRFHPTQKPVKLIEKLILDYSKPNQLILDPFAGSGTTAIACINTNRRYILIEKEEKYCEIAARRIDSLLDQLQV